MLGFLVGLFRRRRAFFVRRRRREVAWSKSLGIRIDFRDEARGKQVTNSNSSRERLTIDARERWI